MQPCEQAIEIGKINNKVDKVIDALQIVAEQKVEIKHILETAREHRDWLLGHQEDINDLKQWRASLSGAQKLLLAIPSLLSAANIFVIWILWGQK